MAYAGVTVNAIELTRSIHLMTNDLVHKLLVAIKTVMLEHTTIPRADLNRFVKVLESEFVRMPEAVVGFSQVFGDQRMRRVAVVASGHGVV